VALADPCGTSTLLGTVATDVLLEDRPTVAPPVGAPAVSVTVPWTVFPPAMDAALRETDCRAGVVEGGVVGEVEDPPH
jgi:hypothetical protein